MFGRGTEIKRNLDEKTKQSIINFSVMTSKKSIFVRAQRATGTALKAAQKTNSKMHVVYVYAFTEAAAFCFTS
jgi:hypothetical protein